MFHLRGASTAAAAGLLGIRGLHGASGLQAPKSALAKLRKKTGYSLSLCKKALDQHGQDVKLAEEWLKAQALELGWEKANKLVGRNTAQGLIGVLVKGNCASMVELNCETDFVARNAQFHQLLEDVATVTHEAASKKTVDSRSVCILESDRDTLSSLKTSHGQSVGDLIALNIGQIGENIVLSRAISMTSDGSVFRLSGLTHPSSIRAVGSEKVQYGRFGSIMAYVESEGGAILMPQGETGESMARQVCQHIIGMNPKRVGDITQVRPRSEEEIEKEAKKRQEDLIASGTVNVDDDGSAQTDKAEEEEERLSDDLVQQDFLLNQDLTVGEILLQTGIEVKDFARYEIGKGLAQED